MSGTRKTKRRAAGDGAVFEYQTTKGTRYGVKFWTDVDGERKQVLRRRGPPSEAEPRGETWTTYAEASKALRAILADDDRGEWVDPSKMLLGVWLDQWAAGLRLAPSTIASYRKNVRLHIKPALGAVPLRSLTTARINTWMRDLEASGRVDHKAGAALSARTVRYCFTILSAALRAAVKQGLISRNPGNDAEPPTADEARAPDMHVWRGDELRAFLHWSAANRETLHTAWLVAATTGVRRGELLALRWRDVDFDAGRISVRRSLGLVRVDGHAKRQVIEGPTKTKRARVVDVDDATIAALKTYRAERGSLALALARDDEHVFATIDRAGRPGPRQPEHFTRDWTAALARCRKDLGDKAPSVIRLHDLRHTHTSLLLRAGTPVKVVSERLGHSSATITLSVYAHVMPGMQREAADTFAALVFGG